MPDTKTVLYNDLLDKVIELSNKEELAGNAGRMFTSLLREYFFKAQTADNKKFDAYLSDFEIPSFLNNTASIFDVDMDELKNYINGEMANSSLNGRIMMSAKYLGAFYSKFPPEYNKLPNEVKDELFEKIKDTNNKFIAAFEKMAADRSADSKRKVIKMVALILKAMHLKTETPFNKLPKPAEEILKSIFVKTDEVFTAKEVQLRDLGDDTKIKQLIKIFFKVKAFNEITDLTALYRGELEKYKKRTLLASGK
jgi:hypothetical protein